MLSIFLQHLDPSLFQNIILGILAIFIPFAIVFLSDILNPKNKEKKSEFEKMMLNDEVFETKKVFWLSVIGIILFSFLAGKDIHNLFKVFAIIAAIIVIIFLWFPFTKMIKFSEGDTYEFEKRFLKKLNFSKICKYKNKNKAKKNGTRMEISLV